MDEMEAPVSRDTRQWRRTLLAVVAFLVFGGSPAMAEERTLMLYGDSLMAGYGLDAGDGFAPQLQAALDASGLDVKLVNASVSGDTSAAGLDRLDWSLGDQPDAVILELGANDMLRGLPVEQARKNLAAILDRLKADGVPVLLAGMYASRSLGPDYVSEFDAMYPALAAEYGATLYPFFLEGVALDPALNLPDMRHPNAKGVSVMVERILPFVADLVGEAG